VSGVPALTTFKTLNCSPGPSRRFTAASVKFTAPNTVMVGAGVEVTRMTVAGWVGGNGVVLDVAVTPGGGVLVAKGVVVGSGVGLAMGTGKACVGAVAMETVAGPSFPGLQPFRAIKATTVRLITRRACNTDLSY
jgi:hypothetical protein